MTTVEIRKVGLLFDCDGKMYKNIDVSIMRDRKQVSIINSECDFLGDVEYTDGTFLSVYSFNGTFVGLEYNSNCELITESEVA